MKLAMENGMSTCVPSPSLYKLERINFERSSYTVRYVPSSLISTTEKQQEGKSKTE